MIELSYYAAYRQMKKPYDVRYKLVQYALEHNISQAALRFGTTRRTVRKWLKRYQAVGEEGLVDQSRRPRHSPRQLTKELAAQIVALRSPQETPNPAGLRVSLVKGALPLKEEYHLPCSVSTIYRVLKRNGLIRQRKKKVQVKRDLRSVKARLRPFEKLQIDLKELCDIPHYYPYYLTRYPRYQLTAREVRTGLMFYSYAYEKTTTNVAVFTLLLGQHLARCGVDLSQVTWQNDNGSEFMEHCESAPFIGAWNNRHGPTLYEALLESMHSQNVRIPPGRKTYNSDVEAAHALIESEFYDIEDYHNLTHFLNKALTYSLYFNYQRKFRYKNNQTPIEIMKTCALSNLNTDLIGIFPPVICDYHLKIISQSGYHVLSSDNS